MRLVSLAPEHLPLLRSAELDSELAFRWRLGGRHPHPDEYAAMAWNDVLCSFLVVLEPADGSGGEPCGIVTAYHPDHASGHCRIAASRLGPRRSHSPSVFRATLLLIDYVFTGWSFRKLYFEVPEYNLSQFESAIGVWLRSEAVLREYTFLADRFWDLHFLALDRSRWFELRGRLVRDVEGRG